MLRVEYRVKCQIVLSVCFYLMLVMGLFHAFTAHLYFIHGLKEMLLVTCLLYDNEINFCNTLHTSNFYKPYYFENEPVNIKHKKLQLMFLMVLHFL